MDFYAICFAVIYAVVAIFLILELLKNGRNLRTWRYKFKNMHAKEGNYVCNIITGRLSLK